MSISTLALRAYQATATTATATAAQGATPATGDDFANVLGRAVTDAVQIGHDADRQTTAALSGQGDLTHVVSAVSRAQLALQTTVALRDRVLQAYQDIIRMPI